MVKLIVVIATKVCVKLFTGHKLKQVCDEAHLLAHDRVEEGHNALVEKGEDCGRYNECVVKHLDEVVPICHSPGDLKEHEAQNWGRHIQAIKLVSCSTQVTSSLSICTSRPVMLPCCQKQMSPDTNAGS